MAITDPRIDFAVLDGRTLTSAEVEAVARRGRQVRLDEAARARNLRAADAVGRLVERGTPIYGVTTGVGALRSRRVPPSERPGHQLRLLRSHSCGAGRPLPAEQVRAAMVVRANQLGAGGAGVSDELLGALVDALNAGFVPFTREFGSLGTGDLTVLADIALALLGEGRAWRGERFDAAETALGDAGLTAPQLGPRDGIAFMSSNAASIGHGALVGVDADRLLSASLRVAALSFLAAGADPIVLDPRVQAARGHPGQVAIAEQMRTLLGQHLGPVESGRERRTAVHDPYPFRAFSQVKGAELDALRELEAILSVELNAAGENALVDPEPPEALPTANFHAGVLALGLDRVRAALAQSAALAASRVSALLDPGLMGLQPALAARPGLDSGAMIVEYTAHAAAADVRLRAGPAAAQTTSVGGGLESHASFAPFSARATQEALDSAAVALASELVVAVRALQLRRVASVAGDAGALFAAAVERMDDDLSDRSLSDDLETARRLVLGEEAI